MEKIGRPAVLAAIAAALLVLNVVFVLGRDGDGVDAPTVTDDIAAGDDDVATSDPDDDTDPGEGEQTDDVAGSDGTTDDTAGDAPADGDTDADDEDAPTADDGLGMPVAGDYTYASSGTWSLDSSTGSEDHELPATATATVETDGDAWGLRLVAGDDYADEFDFVVGADGGLDWTAWVLERAFDSQDSTTAYDCSGDTAHYRPDEQGRTAGHDCESAEGITSTGSVEHLGTEELTLGDGTTVTADRLLYTYTIGGGGTVSGTEFTADGEGRFDFWIDPSTGLRLREVRSISSTTTFPTGSSTYTEDAEFLLESLDPA